jgi:alkaline phosphatase D
MKKIIVLFLFIQSFCLFSQKAALQSGPMVGYCEMKEAQIWLQTTNEALVRIDYYAMDNPKEIFTSDLYKSESSNGFTNHIVLNKLQPGKQYHYDVFLNGKKITLPYETTFSSKKLWMHREDAPDFTEFSVVVPTSMSLLSTDQEKDMEVGMKYLKAYTTKSPIS